MSDPFMNDLLQGLAPLPHWGVIRVEGEDAAKFLHGQLTQDFALLGPQQARLAAYCSAQGRMLASFIAVKPTANEVLLLCSRDVLPVALKRLSMFVLRAKAKLSDASESYVLRGVAGAALQALESSSPPPWMHQRLGDTSLIHLYPADGVARAIWLAPVGTPEPAGEVLSVDLWRWSEVRSGVATVTQAVADAYVPQMLNYESVDGVNFKKGCYPGQEVVARSQFRGTLKRRAYLAHTAAEPTLGQEIVGEVDPSQPAGSVVQTAPHPAGGWDSIACLQVAATSQPLHLGDVGGALLSLLPLPYTLRDDI
jgi:folate-binding protein YgfZ